ncbi:MAG: tRNA dihydrouridine synthase DusB [Clostridia bacterium]|nr:tRNA dihydrouridine synthase DusB [Clostridia bacterium]
MHNYVDIGNFRVNGLAFLAPMAGITDQPFRKLCKEQGAALIYTEMASAKGIDYNCAKSYEITETLDDEHPVALQIFGSDPEPMARTTARLVETGSGDIIDINMGCPAPKIIKGFAGSALMKNPELAYKLITAVVGASNGTPVTVKFRKGWDDEHVNCVEFAQMAQEAGASAVTVHGRTREQFYAGKADWDIIAKVKESVSIPVIGNGDVTKPSDGIKLMRHTGCDAIMVGRASQGNPWIFRGLKDAMSAYVDAVNNGTESTFDIYQFDEDYRPTEDELYDTACRHLTMLTDKYGERGLLMMRKHIAWYIKGRPGAAKLRDAAFKATTEEEVLSLLREHPM